jgi:hypothetical protein
MPSERLTDLEARHIVECMATIDGDSDSSSGMEWSSGEESEDDFIDDMLILMGDEFAESFVQDIGPEHLSLARLRREDAARRTDGTSRNVADRFGFPLDLLPIVVEALEPPAQFSTYGRHRFTGEEGVLLLLRRFRCTDSLLSLTFETGRSTTAISQCVEFMVAHIEGTFPWLIDERSLAAWAPHFGAFAAAFRGKGIPIDNLAFFLDGKLFPVCRPGRYQHVLYSGHKRVHGCKLQGLVFPNGARSAPYKALRGVTPLS